MSDPGHSPAHPMAAGRILPAVHAAWPGAPGAGGHVELPRTPELNVLDAARITAAALTRVVVLAGMPGSGKTTLLASLYECLQRHPSFGGYAFAGSETLFGFERRAHAVRVGADVPVSDGERAGPADPRPLLHLRLRKADLTGRAWDLLFADLAGGVCRLAKDSTDACERLGILRRADRVVVVVDGSRLVAPAARFGVLAGARDLLRRACDAGMLACSARVDVVVSKWDVIDALEPRARIATSSALDVMALRLREDFGARLAMLRFARAAASPAPSSTLPFGYGLAALLPAWVEESGLAVLSPDEPPPPALHREIDRFRVRAPSVAVKF